MDKATPKDVFQANRDRAGPLLAKLKAEGIGHVIDGKVVPSASSQTFETRSPIDGEVLASVARGTAEDIDRAAKAATQAFKGWRDMPAASAGAIFQVDSMNGVFHGVMTPTGPIGTRVEIFQCSSLGVLRPSRASAHLSAKKRKFSAARIAALAMNRWA